jgi:hypothetical protein
MGEEEGKERKEKMRERGRQEEGRRRGRRRRRKMASILLSGNTPQKINPCPTRPADKLKSQFICHCFLEEFFNPSLFQTL